MLKLNKIGRKAFVPSKDSYLQILKAMKNRGEITEEQYLESVRRARATSDLEWLNIRGKK